MGLYMLYYSMAVRSIKQANHCSRMLWTTQIFIVEYDYKLFTIENAIATTNILNEQILTM